MYTKWEDMEFLNLASDGTSRETYEANLKSQIEGFMADLPKTCICQIMTPSMAYQLGANEISGASIVIGHNPAMPFGIKAEDSKVEVMVEKGDTNEAAFALLDIRIATFMEDNRGKYCIDTFIDIVPEMGDDDEIYAVAVFLGSK